ncbi:Vps75p [Sporobolomyces koalae]|uniref:Vps75p n=1 Tax=Sporobolomyces koalae TaxID=500713 RepID=UPI003171C906
MERIDILKAAFGDAQAQKFEDNLLQDSKAQFDAYVHKISLQKPLFKSRSELSQNVPEFWFNALRNCRLTAQALDNVDVEALKHLKDVWIEHNDKDVREYEITFTFSPKNPYFKESKITKKVTVSPPKPSGDTPAPSPHDLDAPLYLLPSSKISWTSDEHNLVKKAPRVNVLDMEEFDEEFDGSTGSFFNWFNEEGEDEMGLAETLLEWWTHATEYAAGLSAMDSDDEDLSGGEFDEEDSDDDDLKKEIDLSDEDSKRPKKKQRK